MNAPGTPHSPWHFGGLTDYIARIMHARDRTAMGPAPVRLTRRQELLAAQEQKRREHRAHVLELLREVKEKHQNVSHV
jgi:hypothetical protein